MVDQTNRKTYIFKEDKAVVVQDINPDTVTPQRVLKLSLCTDKTSENLINTAIDELYDFGMSPQMQLNEEPYLGSDGEITINIYDIEPCKIKNRIDLKNIHFDKLKPLHKQINLQLRRHIELDAKMVNPFDNITITKKTLNKLPFNDNIQISDIDIYSNNVDLSFIKRITFSNQQTTRFDHSYMRGVMIRKFQLDADYFTRALTETFPQGCNVHLDTDLSNVEFLDTSCNVQLKQPNTTISAKNLRRIAINDQSISLLEHLDDLNTIIYIQKSPTTSTIRFHNKLKSLKGFNTASSRLERFIELSDLRGFPLEQFKSIVRNTPPVEYTTFNVRHDVNYIEMIEKIKECWHGVAPYESFNEKDYDNIEAKQTIRYSDAKCEESFKAINIDVPPIIEKIKKYQPITRYENEVMIKDYDAKYNHLFDGFDINTIDNESIKFFLKIQLQEGLIKTKKDLKIWL